MKKLLLVMLLLSGYLFGAINVQTASKADLMTISGIGEKKADAIIKYRKTHRLKSANDLLKVPGIGKNIVNNVKKGVKSKKQAATKKMQKQKKSMKKSAKSGMKQSKFSKKMKSKKSMKKKASKKMKKSSKKMKKSLKKKSKKQITK